MSGKKKIRTLFLTVVLMVATVFSAIPVAAAPGIEAAGTVVDGSLLTTESSAQDHWTNVARGNILAKGIAELAHNGKGDLGISGTTSCHVVCDTLICNLYLEQLDDNGKWYTYKYWNGQAKNQFVYDRSFTYSSAPGGHWYRLKGGHIAIKGSTVESTTTATNGIWVP